MAWRPNAPANWQNRPYNAAPQAQAAAVAANQPRPPQMAGAPAKPATSIVVFSTAENDEIGIRTLMGEYAEGGTNHGRKFYKKVNTFPGQEDLNVFLYFWDERDGPAFSGWWFGNQVGSAQVWSRNQMTSVLPPKTGWTIPWDGEVKRELVVMSAAEKQALDKKEAISRMEARTQEENANLANYTAADWEERVQKATEKAADAEIDTSTALEHARDVLQGEMEDALVQEATRELMVQAKSLAETQRIIAMEGVAAQKAPPGPKAEMLALGERMRKLQTQVKDELQRLKNCKQIKAQRIQDEAMRAEVDAKERELEGTHSKQLEEMMPAAMEKVDAAEDEVEKVAIAAAPLQIDTADDLRPVMLQAIKETETRVRAAQAAIGEARRHISTKLSQVTRFVSTTKKQAVDEFTALQTKLNEAQAKLTPYKTVRQDYEQRAQAKKLYEELSGKLAGAEIEVEKAAMMTAPLGGDSNEGIKETETALSAAQTALSQCTRMIDSKMRGAEKTPGPLRDEIKALQERGKQAQEKLDEVRKTLKETQVRIAADTLLRDVSEKVSVAEDELQRMAEAELPFLRGEKLGEGDMEAYIAEADKVGAKVHTALSEAQTFVAKKLVEVARFTEGPARTVKEEIDLLQKRLEEGRERLQQFRSGTSDRKRAHLLEEVEGKVAAAETELQRLTEATESLSNIGAAGETVAEGLPETVENANLAERSAQASIVVARKYLLQKTAELKKLAVSGSGSGSELGKLQTRVNTMQQEITKLRNATKDAEERIRVKQMLSEVAIRLQTAEAEVEKVASVAVPLAQDQPSAEAIERMDKATTSANTKLGATAKLVDVKLKSAQGFLKEELTGMRNRISAAEKKLGDVVRAATEQKERLQAAELIAQAVEKVEKGEAEVLKASETELPFLKGNELPALEASKAVMACEGAAAGAQKAVTEARTFVVQKLVDAKSFTEGPSEMATKELLVLQKKLDTAASKLSDLKKATAERKRKTQMQASGEKITGVEEAVQKLSDALTKFDDSKLPEISAEEARSVCEELAQVEHDAQAAVVDARKFLSLRLQDAKTFSEAMRGPMTADLTKLQTRLTQCQVELAKLTKQFSEREQKFVAKKLVDDAQASLKKLQADFETATKAATPLLAEDKTSLIQEGLVQTLVAALLALAKKGGLKAEDIFSQISKTKTATLEQFSSFVETLAEASGKEDASFTKEQISTIFSKVGKSGKITAAEMQVLLREQLVCKESIVTTDALDGGKEVGSVEAGEGITVIEKKEDKAGTKRVKCVLARDGSTAWATLSDEGVVYFKAAGVTGKVESIEAYIDAVQGHCSDAAEAVDKKTVELASVKQGPLSEVKNTLLQLRTKFSSEQAKIDTLKKKAAGEKDSVLKQRKEELQKVHEAKWKDFAAKSQEEGSKAVQAAEEQAEKAIASAAKVDVAKLAISKLEGIKSTADAALQALTEAKATVGKSLEKYSAYKGPFRSLLLEARVELTKLTAKADAAEKKLRTATESIRLAHDKAVKEATKKAREVLRAKARSGKRSVDELFEDVAGGEGEISQAKFQKFVGGLKVEGLGKDQVDLVYNEFGKHGLRKPGFAKALQEFLRCETPTLITQAFESSSAGVRRLDQGELFEVLEGPKNEESTSSTRVRGRALRDGTTGWVTQARAGSQPYLKTREKPFVMASLKTSLYAEFDNKSAAVRPLQQDEVLEMLEGPRELSSASELYLKATSCKDGNSGWVTLKDIEGKTYASLSSKVYVCKSTIAMTDVFDISSCKVVRKVDIGEALVVIDGQEEQSDENKSIKRLKFKGTKDDREGWVTLEGNQGTVYMELSKSHYVVDKKAGLRQGQDKDAELVRSLEVGEVVEGLDTPKEVKPDSKLGMKARALEDGKSGWIMWLAGGMGPVKPWAAKYTCKAPVALTPTLEAKDADTIRQTEPGEVFEAVEGPTVDKSTGLRRIRCATADGVVGWATLRSSEGEAFLEV